MDRKSLIALILFITLLGVVVSGAVVTLKNQEAQSSRLESEIKAYIDEISSDLEHRVPSQGPENAPENANVEEIVSEIEDLKSMVNEVAAILLGNIDTALSASSDTALQEGETGVSNDIPEEIQWEDVNISLFSEPVRLGIIKTADGFIKSVKVEAKEGVMIKMPSNGWFGRSGSNEYEGFCFRKDETITKESKTINVLFQKGSIKYYSQHGEAPEGNTVGILLSDCEGMIELPSVKIEESTFADWWQKALEETM